MLIDRHSCGGGSNLVSAVTLLPAEQRRIESSTIRASCGQEGIRPGPCTPITPGAFSTLRARPTRRVSTCKPPHSGPSLRLPKRCDTPPLSFREPGAARCLAPMGVGMPQCLSAPSRLLLERSAPQYRPPHRVVRYMLNRRNLRKVGPAPTFGPLRPLETAPPSQGFGLAVSVALVLLRHHCV